VIEGQDEDCSGEGVNDRVGSVASVGRKQNGPRAAADSGTVCPQMLGRFSQACRVFMPHQSGNTVRDGRSDAAGIIRVRRSGVLHAPIGSGGGGNSTGDAGNGNVNGVSDSRC